MSKKNKTVTIKTLLLFIFLLVLNSCATKEDILYFQNIEQLDNMAAPEEFEPEIEVNDVLQIDVSSMNSDLVAPFTLYGGSSSSYSSSGSSGSQSRGGGGGRSNSGVTGYLVGTDGTIRFPYLGKIEVAGKLRSELEDELTEKLREYVTDAVVRVRITNFTITVLGETGSNNVINVIDSRISVPQAIAMSGNVTYDGKRNNILVIRQEDGEMKYGRVDLTDAAIFQNPYFYLKQNDIVYVEPTYKQVKSAGFITSWQGLVSIVTTAFSLIVLFNR